MKIGVMTESFRLPFRESVERSAALGAHGVQSYASNRGLIITEMTSGRSREALDIVKSNGLVFSALCGDFGGGFSCGAEDRARIELLKRVLDLSVTLECGIITTHISKIPKEECEIKEIMRRACGELAAYAGSIGAVFAIETGRESAGVLAGFIESLGGRGIGVNFDPANVVMIEGGRLVDALSTLAPYIVHTHAKDGAKTDKTPRGYMELPLGEGDVDFDSYLPALAKAGYNGFLTVEREVGENPEEDIAAALGFLRGRVAKYKL